MSALFILPLFTTPSSIHIHPMNKIPLIILYVDPRTSSLLARALLACRHLRRVLCPAQAEVNAQRRSLLHLLGLRSLYQVRYALRQPQGFFCGHSVLPELGGGYSPADFCGAGFVELLEEAIYRSFHRDSGKLLRAMEDNHIRPLRLRLRL